MKPSINGEYVCVCRLFRRRWPNYHIVLRAVHQCPVSQNEALNIVRSFCSNTQVMFSKKSQAYSYVDHESADHQIILPVSRDYRTLGVVLHECAHVIDTQKSQAHNERFCKVFKRLLKNFLDSVYCS